MTQAARPEAAPFRADTRVTAAAGFRRDVFPSYEGWSFETLPPEVVHRVKLFVLDTLGVIAAASGADGIPELNRQLWVWEKAGASTALIGKWRASPPTAAMANGAAAH